MSNFQIYHNKNLIKKQNNNLVQFGNNFASCGEDNYENKSFKNKFDSFVSKFVLSSELKDELINDREVRKFLDLNLSNDELRDKILKFNPLKRSLVVLLANKCFKSLVLETSVDKQLKRDEIFDDIYSTVNILNKKNSIRAYKLVKTDSESILNYKFLDYISYVSNKNYDGILTLIQKNKLSFDDLGEMSICVGKKDKINPYLEKLLRILPKAKVRTSSDLRFISHFCANCSDDIMKQFEKFLPVLNISSISQVQNRLLGKVFEFANNGIYNDEELQNINYYAEFDSETLKVARGIVSAYSDFDYEKDGSYLKNIVSIFTSQENLDRLVLLLSNPKIQKINLNDLSQVIFRLELLDSDNFDFDKFLKLSFHKKINEDNFLSYVKCIAYNKYNKNAYPLIEEFLNDDEITSDDVKYINLLNLNSPNYKNAIPLIKAGFDSWYANELSSLNSEKMKLALLFAQDNVPSDCVKYFIDNFSAEEVEQIAQLCSCIYPTVLIDMFQNNDKNDVLSILGSEKLENNEEVISSILPGEYNENICVLLLSKFFNLNYNKSEIDCLPYRLPCLSAFLNNINYENYLLFEDGYMELLDMYASAIDNNYLEKLSQKDKIELYADFKELIPLKYSYKYLETVEKVENLCMKINNSILDKTCVYQASRSNIVDFYKEIIANNNIKSFNILKNADFEKYAKTGLPLSYSRKDFLRDLNSILDNLDKAKKKDIIEKLEIKLEADAYDGIVNYSKLDKNDEIENKIYLICKKFFMENRVVTDNDELNKILNALIKGFSEFVNIIGKKQHLTHSYTLDIHTLKVLKEAFNNPEYENLSDIDKIILKYLILFHDISKQEGQISPQHPRLSALYAVNLFEKFNVSDDIKNRIYDLIDNHNWLENLASDETDLKILASHFRYYNDYAIAKIFAEADLKSVGDEFYDEKSSIFNSIRLKEFEQLIKQIDKNGQILFPNQIIDKTKVPKVFYKGECYRLIDFSKIDNNQDLLKYGFEKGVNKTNLRLNVHMAPDTNPLSLEILSVLDNPSCEDTICSSLIAVDKKNTFCDYKFGVSLTNRIYNIANSWLGNQESGFSKGFEDFSRFLFNDNVSFHPYRTYLPLYLKKILKLSDEEYIEFYKQISDFKYLSAINKDFKIGKRTLKKENVIKAIRKAQDCLLNNQHNEINSYNPKINAFVAKVDSIGEIPERFLAFARENDLPVLLLGKD